MNENQVITILIVALVLSTLGYVIINFDPYSPMPLPNRSIVFQQCKDALVESSLEVDQKLEVYHSFLQKVYYPDDKVRYFEQVESGKIKEGD